MKVNSKITLQSYLMNNIKTIAIIGASHGQKCLYEKAREMGLRIIGFAWDKGILTEDLYDEFYEISVKDTDGIVDICKGLQIDGVVTNASEFLMPLAASVAERLGLPCTPSGVISVIQDKEMVRELTEGIHGLTSPEHHAYKEGMTVTYPCVVKPVKGAAKKGVSYCKNKEDVLEAVAYAGGTGERILIEEYIPGREISVESLSYNGQHTIVQITDKDSSGPPHFVELGHHQPSSVSEENKERIKKCIRFILDAVGFTNGATQPLFPIGEWS